MEEEGATAGRWASLRAGPGEGGRAWVVEGRGAAAWVAAATVAAATAAAATGRVGVVKAKAAVVKAMVAEGTVAAVAAVARTVGRDGSATRGVAAGAPMAEVATAVEARVVAERARVGVVTEMGVVAMAAAARAAAARARAAVATNQSKYGDYGYHVRFALFLDIRAVKLRMALLPILPLLVICLTLVCLKL